ncbi:MAG: IclR family transcriptional regulator [Pseudomonadota bacterium]
MAAQDAKNHGSYFVPGLAKGLQVLEAVAAAEAALTTAEIARASGLTRSAAFRLVYTLRHLRYLEEADAAGKTYRVGPRVLNLGFAWLDGQEIAALAEPDLRQLCEATGVSAHLAVLEGTEIVYLVCVNTARAAYVSNITVGSRRPAHASPLGWLLLGGLGGDAIAARYDETPLEAATAHTPTSRAALIERATASARAGYVVSRGFLAPGGVSIAAPVRERGGAMVAAIDISGPESAFDAGPLETAYLPKVAEAAARISERLGSAHRAA